MARARPGRASPDCLDVPRPVRLRPARGSGPGIGAPRRGGSGGGPSPCTRGSPQWCGRWGSRVPASRSGAACARSPRSVVPPRRSAWGHSLAHLTHPWEGRRQRPRLLRGRSPVSPGGPRAARTTRGGTSPATSHRPMRPHPCGRAPVRMRISRRSRRSGEEQTRGARGAGRAQHPGSPARRGSVRPVRDRSDRWYPGDHPDPERSTSRSPRAAAVR